MSAVRTKMCSICRCIFVVTDLSLKALIGDHREVIMLFLEHYYFTGLSHL